MRFASGGIIGGMAQRRMTSLDVVDTDAFLDMPTSSQLLYFHLNSRADDDGFVSNPKRILRAIGGNADDMKVLLLKKFIIAFDDGVCVIKHWRINNFIRKDIYTPTKYLDLKKTLFIRANGAYTQSDDGRSVPVPSDHFRLDTVDAALTRRQLSIGKDSIGKVREGKTTSPDGDGYTEAFNEFWVAYPKKVGKGAAFKTWEKMKPVGKALHDRIIASVLDHVARDKQWKKDGGQFIPNPATFLNQKRYDDDVQEGITSKTDRFA